LEWLRSARSDRPGRLHTNKRQCPQYMQLLNAARLLSVRELTARMLETV